MTILINMEFLTMDKQFLEINDNKCLVDKHKQRSERASSLALPHNSLLDFYDKQQEQCNSVALLPVSGNVVIRRHSSHCYPTLENANQQHQQQQQQLNCHRQHQKQRISQPKASQHQQLLVSTNILSKPGPSSDFGEIENKKSVIASVRNLKEAIIDGEMQIYQPILPLPSPKMSASFMSQLQQHNRMQQQEANNLNSTPLSTKRSIKNPSEMCQIKYQQQQHQPSNAPPPIPKRTFRNNFIWNSLSNTTSSGSRRSPTPPSSATSITQTSTKGRHQTIEGTDFIYSQDLQQMPTVGCGFARVENTETTSSLCMELKSRPSYSESISHNYGSGYDTSGASDDEHMSLENSVFEESLNSTPVRLPGNSQGKQLNTTLAAKSLATLTGDVNNVLKRLNRSSSSTVDSSITSSGYGSSSHSDRFASTSTTADVRSRFSSVDTQSSVDICLMERASADPPLTSEVSYKRESRLNLSTTNEVLYTLNNNEMNSDILSQRYVMGSNNNNGCSFSIQQPNKANGVPNVPKRGGQCKNTQLHNNKESLQFHSQSHSQHSLNNSISSSNKACSTVPNSTSTSSTASAGSSISTGSLVSISASGSGNSPQAQQPQLAHPKRPPIPPARVQNTEAQRSINANVKNYSSQPPLAVRRNKLNRNKCPPSIQYPKPHQRQDSDLSSESFTAASNPLPKNAADINKCSNAAKTAIRHEDSHDSFLLSSTKFSGTAPILPPRNKFNFRQDSTISSDSFSQISSPGYNTKTMEVPLLPSLSVKRLCNVSTPINIKQKFSTEAIDELGNNVPMSVIPKCVSTPASLQTIVKFQNGTPNTMSLSHQIISRRKSSNPYVTNGRLRFRLFQILINALALLVIAGCLAAYFNAYPTIKFVNKTIINTVHVEDSMSYGKNPAPGTCLPIIVKFCQGPQIPYNFTVFPNYIGHFGQLETQVDMDAYEALVDVRCYELVSLFLCTLFVPKCGNTGATVPPCKSLCTETMRRCGFFFDVFGLSLPEYLNCKLFKDFESPDDCVGLEQVQNVMIASANPKCDGFLCDNNRCIPKDYVCDGNLDCMDHADEKTCEICPKDGLFCGNGKCITTGHICNGVYDCPYGQDEKNCIRLSERNGDLGKGILEVFRINTTTWTPACVKNWDRAVSPSAVCSMLGYSAVNATSVITQKTHRPLLTSVNVSTDIWKMYAKKKFNLMKEFSNCTPDEDYPIAELTCSNFECGKVKKITQKLSRRIIGGARAHPGSWPFLAAILGGPEKIFYCAGVLISDQWVLTASHCIGNHTIIDLEDWTIQLGITRRNSYTYSSQEVKVKTVIPHPLYNTAITHDNDIALFQLHTRVAFHEHLLPVCLPPPNMKQLKPDAMCTVIGWGKRRDKDPTATYEPIVNEVQVPIIRRQQCDEWLDNLTVSDGMICAGYEEGGKDACQGDSGGPLLCPYPGEKDKWFVGGIVSWGIMCAHPKLPGVYANVIKYLPWINEQIQKYSREETYSKYDVHPGGPDILSNLATVSLKSNKHSYKSSNRSPMDIDYYESEQKKPNGEYTN